MMNLTGASAVPAYPHYEWSKTMPAANWVEDAQQITVRRAYEDRYLDLADLADHVRLSQFTIRDALSRPKIEEPTIPLGALSRPAAYIGGKASPSPMWSREQVAEYDRRAKALREAPVNTPQLPEVTAEEAEEQGLASIEKLAIVCGVAPNTLRRWARLYRSEFPEEVAIAKREAPNHRGRQHRLRSQKAVQDWIEQHQASEGQDDRTPEVAGARAS